MDEILATVTNKQKKSEELGPQSLTRIRHLITVYTTCSLVYLLSKKKPRPLLTERTLYLTRSFVYEHK